MHVKPEEIGMTPSPTANRSFLHGGERSPPCLNSDKIIYATLDSLALKRATLPLKLLPIDNNHIVDNSGKIDNNKEKIIPRKTSSRKPSFKVSAIYILTIYTFILRVYIFFYCEKKNFYFFYLYNAVLLELF